MSLANAVRLFFLCLIVLAIASAYAADDRSTGADVDVRTDTSVNTEVLGSTQKHSNRALALSNGLGDVDIAGCLGSTQWSTPVYSRQKLVINWPCMAEFYLRNAQYSLAAMAICNTEILSEFDTEAACEASHNFAPLHVEPVAAMVAEPVEDNDEWRREQYEIVSDLQEKVALLEAAKKPPAQVTRQVVQQPFLSDAKRAALAELVKK